MFSENLFILSVQPTFQHIHRNHSSSVAVRPIDPAKKLTGYASVVGIRPGGWLIAG